MELPPCHLCPLYHSATITTADVFSLAYFTCLFSFLFCFFLILIPCFLPSVFPHFPGVLVASVSSSCYFSSYFFFCFCFRSFSLIRIPCVSSILCFSSFSWCSCCKRLFFLLFGWCLCLAAICP